MQAKAVGEEDLVGDAVTEGEPLGDAEMLGEAEAVGGIVLGLGVFISIIFDFPSIILCLFGFIGRFGLTLGRDRMVCCCL
jgi:hypothetical protein